MKPLVIFGTGNIAELAEYYFRKDTDRKIVAFTTDGAFVKEPKFNGYPVAAFEEVQDAFPPASHDFFVAVSYAQLNALRANKMAEAESKGYALTSYVSSRAFVWDGFSPGPNAFILEDNTIQPFCRVGRGVTLWSGNHIGHHSTIGDYCFIASHVVISGGVTIGNRCFIGVNATLRDHIRIGDRVVLGAGAVIMKDAPDEAVYVAPQTEAAKIPSSKLRHL